ncbi:probable G-protein coupled receptor 132 isoform X1 [Conger conger]|uniref:probable G-protein coupled receptor 132 isoform X1 n=2 Tax=Conger conger TaxID=82655 RepID=UPI002A5AD93E|nr:probable G-protein coupled receptor 132 isoform X1 [Conger conger]
MFRFSSAVTPKAMHESSVTQSALAGDITRNMSNCTTPYSQGRIPLIALYSTVLIIGLPANIATVFMTFLQVQRKNVLGIYLLSLSLCDLMYLGTLPLWAAYVSAGHEWMYGSLACKVTSYVFFNNMYISIFLLCCVSIDRYVAVVYAVESRGLRRQKLAGTITLVICLVVALGHVPVFTMSEGDADTGDKRCFEPGQSTAMVTGFNYARFVIGFFIPLGILVVTNHSILVNIQASTGLRPQQKAKVRYLAMAVIAFFLVCFGPYHIILLLRAVMYHFPSFQKGCHFENSIYTPYTISLGLSTFNSALNPILYVLASDNIRKEIRRGLASFRSRSALQRPFTDSSQHKMHNSKNSSDMATVRENKVT